MSTRENLLGVDRTQVDDEIFVFPHHWTSFKFLAFFSVQHSKSHHSHSHSLPPLRVI